MGRSWCRARWGGCFSAAGGLTSAHVRAGAQLAGVHPRTVWRWVAAVRCGGRVERRRRSRFELSEKAWEVLAQAGGNVPVLYRHLKECGDGDAGVSPASVYRAVQRELVSGRVLPDRAVVRLAVSSGNTVDWSSRCSSKYPCWTSNCVAVRLGTGPGLSPNLLIDR